LRALGAALLLVLPAAAEAQFCPCYTLSSTNNNGNCGVEAANGTNPSVAQWQGIFALVAGGPASWGTQGPSVGDIGEGCGKPTASHPVAAKFPCELLKAIAMQETGWRQFCVPTTPSDQVGGPSRTIISFDCGYGIGQVTSGMHKGEAPAFDRARVASNPTYNMATGTQILASKWRATNCVGDNLPSVVEHWYTSTWAYNGLAYSNNPANPAYASTRGVYNPSVGGSRPYQEKVWGWMEHPPTVNHWTVLRPSYPNPSQVGTSGAPPDLPEPTCATPTDCVAKRTTHVSSCFGGTGGGAGGGAGGGSGGAGGGAGGSGGSGGAGGSGGGSGGAGGGGAGGGSGGAGGVEPIRMSRASETLGRAPGCGCGAVDGALAWAALLTLAALRRHRSR
jgi:hypothetical protein